MVSITTPIQLTLLRKSSHMSLFTILKFIKNSERSMAYGLLLNITKLVLKLLLMAIKFLKSINFIKILKIKIFFKSF